MEFEITLQIILVKPTEGVVFGLQKGAGSNYETIQKQIATTEDMTFTFEIKVKGDKSKDELPKFSGSFVQGPSTSRFIYIDIGTSAGQVNSKWSRRLKIPLSGITWEDIDTLSSNSILQTSVSGTGKDGGPNCATVKPFEGWHVRQRNK